MPNKSQLPPPGAQADPPRRPVLSVLRGQPTEAELAAVVAVLGVRAHAAAALASAPGPASASHSAWSDRSRLLREPIVRARGGWRASALPR
ncbi:MAG TPA: acyl-CoA carboxylase subunit epsilon [Streptosporangiaceae bacterium]|nr:acyl-CoA carboxylase subunit epsilon [Streptosporangiaceae bacterium]